MPGQKQLAILKNVTFTYPAGNRAIDKVNLNIFKSEIIGIVGANASGKTTLLKLIAGYLSLGGGSIELESKSIAECNERMLNDFMTFVEQNPESQLTGPTVEDELARNCRMIGLKGREIENKVTSILNDVDLKDGREWFLDEISVGERRRVALGLTLLGSPKMLLLDEPLSDLDVAGAKNTVSFLKRYKEKGVSIILSSQRIEDVMNFADRVGILSQGSLLIVNKPEVVVSETKSLEEAGLNTPPISALCLALKSDGMITFEKCPLGVQEARDLIQAAVKK